jgi:hypothetical protein
VQHPFCNFWRTVKPRGHPVFRFWFLVFGFWDFKSRPLPGPPDAPLSLLPWLALTVQKESTITQRANFDEVLQPLHDGLCLPPCQRSLNTLREVLLRDLQGRCFSGKLTSSLHPHRNRTCVQVHQTPLWGQPGPDIQPNPRFWCPVVCRLQALSGDHSICARAR